MTISGWPIHRTNLGIKLDNCHTSVWYTPPTSFIMKVPEWTDKLFPFYVTYWGRLLVWRRPKSSMVAMFLHILAHDVKNRVIQRDFVRSGETVSRHFNLVLFAVLRLHNELLKKPQPVTTTCTDSRWSCFEVHILLYHVTYQSPRPVTNWVVFHSAELPWGIGWHVHQGERAANR